MIKFPLTSAPEQLSLITDCCSNAFTVITFPLDVNTIKLNTYNIALSASTTSNIWAFTVFAKIGLFVALMCLLMLADFSEQIWRERKWANMNKHEYNLCYQHGLSWCACWQSVECETNAYQGVTIEIIPVKRMFSFLDARQDTQCTPYKWNMFYHWTLLTWAGIGIIWDNMWLSHWLCLVCLKIDFSLFVCTSKTLVGFRLLKVSN